MLSVSLLLSLLSLILSHAKLIQPLFWKIFYIIFDLFLFRQAFIHKLIQLIYVSFCFFFSLGSYLQILGRCVLFGRVPCALNRLYNDWAIVIIDGPIQTTTHLSGLSQIYVKWLDQLEVFLKAITQRWCLRCGLLSKHYRTPIVYECCWPQKLYSYTLRFLSGCGPSFISGCVNWSFDTCIDLVVLENAWQCRLWWLHKHNLILPCAFLWLAECIKVWVVVGLSPACAYLLYLGWMEGFPGTLLWLSSSINCLRNWLHLWLSFCHMLGMDCHLAVCHLHQVTQLL
jgi:hypothetical protein